jgi:hypothetical protein
MLTGPPPKFHETRDILVSNPCIGFRKACIGLAVVC